MSLSFDPDQIQLPVGHFIGDRLQDSPGLLPLHRPSDGAHYAACPVASAETVDEAVQTARKALKASNWGGRTSVRASQCPEALGRSHRD